MTAASPGPAPVTPGQAAFGAMHAACTAGGWKCTPWDDIGEDYRQKWEAAAQAVLNQSFPGLKHQRDEARAVAAEILGTFYDSGDGRRARVGQVQIAKWRQRAGLEDS